MVSITNWFYLLLLDPEGRNFILIQLEIEIESTKGFQMTKKKGYYHIKTHTHNTRNSIEIESKQ